MASWDILDVLGKMVEAQEEEGGYEVVQDQQHMGLLGRRL